MRASLKICSEQLVSFAGLYPPITPGPMAGVYMLQLENGRAIVFAIP